MNTHPIAIVLLTAALAACASHATPPGARAGRADPEMITGDELTRSTASNLYDAVRNLRPAWMMRSRPTAVLQQQQAQLIVYVDGTRYGTLETLRQIVPAGIIYVKYFSAGAAEARFGPGHLLGAIEVVTRQR
jgi:hypothetical protein